MRFIDWILAAAAALWAAEGCLGAELKGRVTDQSGAALSESTVVARAAGGLATRQITDERGHYRFADLAPGVYSVRIGKTGFNASAALEVVVKGAENARLPTDSGGCRAFGQLERRRAGDRARPG